MANILVTVKSFIVIASSKKFINFVISPKKKKKLKNKINKKKDFVVDQF